MLYLPCYRERNTRNKRHSLLFPATLNSGKIKSEEKTMDSALAWYAFSHCNVAAAYRLGDSIVQTLTNGLPEP